MISFECCSLYFESKIEHVYAFYYILLYSVIFIISLFYSVLLPLSCSLLRHIISLTEHFSLYPSEVLRDSSPIWDIARVQKYSCLIKSSYVPGYVCLNWHLAVCSFFDSTSLFKSFSTECWLLLTVVWSCEADPNSINNLCGCLRKRWSI